MNGNAKKIVAIVMIAVLVVSALAIVASLHRKLSSEEPSTVIQASLEVTDPMRSVDSNSNEEPDYVENVDVEASDSEAESFVDENDNGMADSQEIAEENIVDLSENGDSGTATRGTEEISAPEDNKTMNLIKPGKLTENPKVDVLFPGYADAIKWSLKDHGGIVDIAKEIKKAAFGLPQPDMRWITQHPGIAKEIHPAMYFNEDGFNGTSLNFTSITHVEKVDKNNDGYPEYFKKVSYSNLTQDDDKDEKYELIVVKYSEHVFYDNNSDGYHEYDKWVSLFAYLQDKDEDGYYEVKVVQAIGGFYKDDNSDGNREVVKAYAVGNQTKDINENGKYEFHLVMFGVAEKYDNNSNGNFESVKAYFGVRAVKDENEDSVPELMAVTVTGYKMIDKNDDGYPENETFIHWRYKKIDENSDGNYEHVKGIAAYATYYDNNSDGNKEYAIMGIKAIAYEDSNDNGTIESGAKGFALWKVKDENDDGYNESMEFAFGMVNGTDEDEDGNYEFAWKLYGAYGYYDNNSDGNPEYRHFVLAGWIIGDRDNNGIREHAGILYTELTMRDDNSDGMPNEQRSGTFYREIWDRNQDRIYEKERGVAEVNYRYDNNSNGVCEVKSLKLFGYSLYRNATNNNITHITLVVINGNATNTDDTGFYEYENFTLLIVHKDDANANGNPEYVSVWEIKHNQFVNETGLINITIMGSYKYVDRNDNGLRDTYWVNLIKITRIDYNLDGIWDSVTREKITHTGSDESS